LVFFQGLRDLGYVDGLRSLATPEPIKRWTLTCSPHRKRSMTRNDAGRRLRRFDHRHF
jgi:hypothetical protein